MAVTYRRTTQLKITNKVASVVSETEHVLSMPSQATNARVAQMVEASGSTQKEFTLSLGSSPSSGTK